MTKLTVEAVNALMTKCLYKQEELKGEEKPEGTLLVKGIIHDYGFHPDRVKEAKPEIDALLSELPEQFFRDRGGGWSFLNACMDKHGRHWGEHWNIECLISLGIAVGSASWVMLGMQSILPGGVPYLEIHPFEEAKDESPQVPGN